MRESQPEYRIVSEKNVPARMRDGTLLYADIYRPDAEGRFPVLLLRLPYGKDRVEFFGDHEYYPVPGLRGRGTGHARPFRIDLWATSHVFAAGHRPRVEISSSNFPRFDRNLNTGGDQATGARFQAADQTVFHGGRLRSHIVLPVIPQGR